MGPPVPEVARFEGRLAELEARWAVLVEIWSYSEGGIEPAFYLPRVATELEDARRRLRQLAN